MPSPELHTGLYEILTCNIHGQCRKDWLEVIAIYLVSDKLCDRNAIFERLSDASAHQKKQQHRSTTHSAAHQHHKEIIVSYLTRLLFCLAHS